MDDFPIKTTIYGGFSMAILNNQMVEFGPQAPCLHLLMHRPRGCGFHLQMTSDVTGSRWQSPRRFRHPFHHPLRPKLRVLQDRASIVIGILGVCCLLQVSESKAGSTRGTTGYYCNIQRCLKVAMFNFNQTIACALAARGAKDLMRATAQCPSSRRAM